MTNSKQQDEWTGRKCPECNGCGETRQGDYEQPCPACGGTGDEYAFIPAPPADQLDDDDNDGSPRAVEASCEPSNLTAGQRECVEILNRQIVMDADGPAVCRAPRTALRVVIDAVGTLDAKLTEVTRERDEARSAAEHEGWRADAGWSRADKAEALLAGEYRNMADAYHAIRESLGMDDDTDPQEVVDAVGRMRDLLRRCRSDIFQTARTNQTNLTGIDLITPKDRPLRELIGKHPVHQQGIDESLALVRAIDAALTPADGEQAEKTDDKGPGTVYARLKLVCDYAHEAGIAKPGDSVTAPEFALIKHHKAMRTTLADVAVWLDHLKCGTVCQCQGDQDCGLKAIKREVSALTAGTALPLNETGGARLLPNGRLGCLDCGVPYASSRFPDLIIDHDAFASIAPNPPDGGLLCPNCINARLEAKGLSGVRAQFKSGPMAAHGEQAEQQLAAAQQDNAALREQLEATDDRVKELEAAARYVNEVLTIRDSDGRNQLADRIDRVRVRLAALASPATETRGWCPACEMRCFVYNGRTRCCGETPAMDQEDRSRDATPATGEQDNSSETLTGSVQQPCGHPTEAGK